MGSLQEPQLRIPLDLAEQLERHLRELARLTGRDYLLQDADSLQAFIAAQFGPMTQGPGH